MALAINFNNINLPSMNTATSPRKGNEINNNLRLKSKKCLFGPTNPEETYQMVKENFDQERDRFYQRFGVHMEDLDRFAIDEDEYRKLKSLGHFNKPPQQECAAGGKMVNRKLGRMKRALRPYNAQAHHQGPSTQQQQPQHNQQQQMKMTDFCQVKKSPTSSTLQYDSLKNKLPQQNGL